MTHAMPLSARIAALEADAAPLEELLAEYQELESRLDALDTRIDTARHAHRLLSLIEVQVAVALEGDSTTVEITGGAAPELGADLGTVEASEPHEANQVEQVEADAPVSSEASALPEPAVETEGDVASSTIISEPELEAANPADDDEDQGEPISDRDRVVAWVRTLEGNEFAAADAADELELTKNSSETHLRDMLRGGLVSRVEGTGRPGVPSRFREVGRHPEPTPENEADDKADPDPDPSPIGPGPWDDASLSANARARLLLLTHPGLTTKQIAAALGKQEKVVSPALRVMIDNGALQTLGDWPRRYYLTEPVMPSARPDPAPSRPDIATPKLPPVPADLNHDESNLFDCLRREPAGLTDRVLAARLNWGTQSRVNAILASLSRKGHVGRNGDRFVVVPEELAGVAS